MGSGAIRVVQIGMGPIGQAVARVAAGRAGMTLCGAADVDPALVGRDVGEILDLEPTGFAVDASIEALLERARPDLALHATGSRLEQVVPQIRPCLERGVSVVSTCEELSYPFYSHPDLAADLDRRAREHGAVLLGTGVNPGFVLDKLVATLLSACSRVDRVSAVRILDASRRRRPLLAKIGAGLAPEEFEARRAQGEMGHVGLAESAHLLADVIGVSRQRWIRESIAPMVAEKDVRTEAITVLRGQVLGVSQTAALEALGRERVRLQLELYVGAAEPRDTVVIDGWPNLEMTLPGGVPGDEAAAAVAVNCAIRARELAPGLRTVLDVPLRFEAAGG